MKKSYVYLAGSEWCEVRTHKGPTATDNEAIILNHSSSWVNKTVACDLSLSVVIVWGTQAHVVQPCSMRGSEALGKFLPRAKSGFTPVPPSAYSRSSVR
jgi:hypothetical protein